MYLNCHTHFSFGYGTLSVEELVAAAKERGAEVLALTDIHNCSAVYDFVSACREAGIHPIVGMQFRQGHRHLYTGLARTNEGFRELNTFHDRYIHAGEAFPAAAPLFDDVVWVYTLDSPGLPDAPHPAWRLGIRPWELGRLYTSPWRQHMDGLIVWQPVVFLHKQGYNLHRLLCAVHQNAVLSKLPPEATAHPESGFPHVDELTARYRAWPRLIYNTMALAGMCSFRHEAGVDRNRKTFTGNAADDRALLRKLALDGATARYGRAHREAIRRVEHELDIIGQLCFPAYFLITWDIVRYAQHRGFFHVGRGSGANSIVAYCLGITDVDPIALDLYFERFLNLHRTSPPDFDIDFSWKDRDEVTDYIFKRYGTAHTALLATYVTYQGRSIVRELGKVFGLPKAEIDALVAHPNEYRDRDHITRLIFRYGQLMEDRPRHLSIHAGGVLITEEPMCCHTATDVPPKGFPITHFDMFAAEDNGFYKYDILSQRGLGHIKEAADLVRHHRGTAIDIHRVDRFMADPALNARLAEGDTIGCFYIESPAMRQLLQKLRCDNYPELVAASSIIRPGVAKSGMMRQYIHRKHHPDSFEYIHPKMGELLAETYGVMVYQEDVIKVAHHFAGIGLAEADVLRRGMSGKRRSRGEMQKIEADFFNNCVERGISEAIAREVWRQIESFSGYSFSKAHSASFAVESYQSLFLKHYFPAEFITAVLNNFGGFYNTEFYVREAQRSGITVEAPCINRSEVLASIHEGHIVLGFGLVNGLEERTIRKVLADRAARGPYDSLAHLASRVSLPVEQLALLVRVGAFRTLGTPKRALLWEAQLQAHKPEAEVVAEPLFPYATRTFVLPELEESALADAYDEIELLGFTLRSPFWLLQHEHPQAVSARELPQHVGKTVLLLGNLHTIKPVRTVKGELMQFAGFWDPGFGMFDTVHFPDTVKRYPLRGPGFYLIEGKVTEEFGVCSVEVLKLEKVGYRNLMD
jgi:error-prone DNA polymerase